MKKTNNDNTFLNKLIYKEGKKLLNSYKDSIAFYNVANELFIYLDTYADAASANMAFELRYALDHLVESLKLYFDDTDLINCINWIKNNSENNISELTYSEETLNKITSCTKKIKSANAHIIRCAYDSFEILCLERLDEIETTINKTSQTVLHSVGLNVMVLYQDIYKMKKEIASLKIKKHEEIKIEDLQELLIKAQNYLDFYDRNMTKIYNISQEEKKVKRFNKKTFIISMVINTIVSIGVTVIVTFLCELFV